MLYQKGIYNGQEEERAGEEFKSDWSFEINECN